MRCCLTTVSTKGTGTLELAAVWVGESGRGTCHLFMRMLGSGAASSRFEELLVAWVGGGGGRSGWRGGVCREAF